MANPNLVIDDEAFSKASEDFEALCARIDKLSSEINTMMSGLETGFNTTAGRKFVNSCKNNLIQPINDQKAVIHHISETLGQVKTKYEPVFTEYEALNTAIKNVK